VQRCGLRAALGGQGNPLNPGYLTGVLVPAATAIYDSATVGGATTCSTGTAARPRIPTR
jgi:hypothetical protein